MKTFKRILLFLGLKILELCLVILGYLGFIWVVEYPSLLGIIIYSLIILFALYNFCKLNWEYVKEIIK